MYALIAQQAAPWCGWSSGAGIDELRLQVQLMTQRLMQLDVADRCGAAYNEKNFERLNSRDGCRDRIWETRAGSVELQIPKLRQCSNIPESLEPHRTSEKAVIAVIQEAYVQGIHPLGGQARQVDRHERLSNS